MTDLAGTSINWTREMLARFKVDYEQAKADGKDVFSFDGNTYLVAYARYLIEYLDGQFGYPRPRA